MVTKYDEILKPEDLAEYLSMKIGTIYKHAQNGKLPGFKVGYSWRFRKSTIDRWIAEQEEGQVIH